MAHADTVAAVTSRLAAAGISAARAEARWLVAHALAAGSGPPSRNGSGPPHDPLEVLVRRREAHEPLQLLLGSWPFRGVELLLEPGVFLPRPETEVVAGLAIDHAAAAGHGAVVAEPCTGSGAIAASLLAEVPGATVHATDIDPAAVDLARRNLGAVAGGERFVVHQGDLLDPLPVALCGRVDVLVANPPYLPTSDAAHLDVEVADHDPAAALFGGPVGNEVVDRLLGLAPKWLRPGGVVVLEIDARQGDAALAAAARTGFATGALFRDLAGRDRALVARWPQRTGGGTGGGTGGPTGGDGATDTRTSRPPVGDVERSAGVRS